MGNSAAEVHFLTASGEECIGAFDKTDHGANRDAAMDCNERRTAFEPHSGRDFGIVLAVVCGTLAVLRGWAGWTYGGNF